MSRMALVFALAVLAATVMAVGAGASGRPAYLLARCNALAIRPQAVAPCGENRQQLLALRWTRWGGARATATGSLYTNTCIPDCPSGQGRIDKVRVTASRLIACHHGRRQYTRLTYAPAVAGAFPVRHARLPCVR
jgi:hypothetical protein